MKYIGKRTPYYDNLQYDLEKYQSSTTDLEFKKEMEEHSERFEFSITAIFNDSYLCAWAEITQHKFYGVGENPDYYNKATQSSIGFDTAGKEPWNKGLKGDELKNYKSKHYKVPDHSAQRGKYNGMYEKKHKQLSLNIMSTNRKGKCIGKNHPNSKIVNEYDIEWNFIKEWESAEEANSFYGFGGNVVNGSCRKGNAVFGISYFRYKD